MADEESWRDLGLVWREPPLPNADEPLRTRLRRAHDTLLENPFQWALMMTTNTKSSSELSKAGIREENGFESRHLRRRRTDDDKIRGTKDVHDDVWVYDHYTRFNGRA